MPLNTSSPTTTRSAATAISTGSGSSTAVLAQAVETVPGVALLYWIVAWLALLLAGGLVL